MLGGPGVADMKSGLAVMLAALQAVEGAGVAAARLRGGDQQRRGGRLARLGGADRRGGAGQEGGADLRALRAARRHAGRRAAGQRQFLDRRSTGRSAHAGRNPEEGRNAVLAAADLALRLAEAKRAGPDASIRRRIDGGGPNNVVPDKAVLRVNMRPRTPARPGRGAGRCSTRRWRRSRRSTTSRSTSMAASAGRPSRSMPRREKLFELVARCGADLGQDDRLARHRRRLRRQQYRRLRRAGGRHDGRARRRDPFGRGISDRREPGRARAIVGADDPAARRRERHCELQGPAGAERAISRRSTRWPS